jgi:uncharacterized protein (TIGR02391 family)
MGTTRLDPVLLHKLVKKTQKKEQYLREQIAKRANRLGISSEAELVLWAKQVGIGTGTFQRNLSPAIQTEIRETLPAMFSSRSSLPTKKNDEKGQVSQKSVLAMAIEYLINDEELRDRCKDLLKATRNYDRVFREATTVLEDRIKRLSGIRGMRGASLVSKIINPQPDRAVLKVSNEAYEQQGFHDICRGIMLAFRDTTHHDLRNTIRREDALKFCGFVDSILGILGNASKQEVT